MKIKVKDLTGDALNFMVAKCEGDGNWPIWKADKYYCKPSTDWAQGGPIIERVGITVARNDQKSYMGQQPWVAYLIEHLFLDEYEHEYQNGITPLVAAMRCYVASRLGEEVDVPEELLDYMSSKECT